MLPSPLLSSALVSVVTVVRNGERYLKDALRSALGQSLQPWEILVVDGQSTDDTARIAQGFSQVRYFRQPDLGLANARNLGLAEARGELVAFLDHDDWWFPEKLEAQVRYLRLHPEVLYCTTQMRFATEAEAVRCWDAGEKPPLPSQERTEDQNSNRAPEGSPSFEPAEEFGLSRPKTVEASPGPAAAERGQTGALSSGRSAAEWELPRAVLKERRSVGPIPESEAGVELGPPRSGCTPSALLARASLFQDLGGFDPQYTIGCDADWFTRARDRGIPSAELPQVLLYKRRHLGNLSTDAARNRREMFHIARRSLARQQGR